MIKQGSLVLSPVIRQGPQLEQEDKLSFPSAGSAATATALHQQCCQVQGRSQL